MAKGKVLPKKVFIRWNMDIAENWLECSDDPELLGEFRGQVAGEYELKRKIRITHKTEIRPIK